MQKHEKVLVGCVPGFSEVRIKPPEKGKMDFCSLTSSFMMAGREKERPHRSLSRKQIETQCRTSAADGFYTAPPKSIEKL